MSSTTSTYVFFFYLESPIITLYREKKFTKMSHTMVYRAYYEKWCPVRKVLRNWDTFFGHTCRSDFMGISWKTNNKVPWTYLILTMSPRHFKVENTMDFEIEMELHFYFKSHCNSRENTWSSSGIVLFDCFCHERPKKVGIYVFNNS